MEYQYDDPLLSQVASAEERTIGPVRDEGISRQVDFILTDVSDSGLPGLIHPERRFDCRRQLRLTAYLHK